MDSYVCHRRDNIAYDDSLVDNSKSGWNMADLTTKRLHDLIVICDRSQVQENNRGWYLALKALFIQLTPYINADQSRLFLQLHKDSCKVEMNLRNKKQDYHYDVTKLASAQMMLMNVMHKVGLLLPGKDDPSKAVLG